MCQRTGSFIHIVFVFKFFCWHIADLPCCDSFYWTMIPVVSYFRQNNHSLFSALVSAFAYLHYITCYSGLEFTFPDCIHLWGRNLILFVILSLTLLALSSVQSLSCVQLFAPPWTAARQASLSITDSQTLLKLMSIESVIPSNHLILCHLAHNMPSVNG